jgi:hypothetical protein
VLTSPLARWFAMIPAIEARHGVESGRSWVARSVSAAMIETETYLRTNYQIV